MVAKSFLSRKKDDKKDDDKDGKEGSTLENMKSKFGNMKSKFGKKKKDKDPENTEMGKSKNKPELIISGPIQSSAAKLNEAMKGTGTEESEIVDEILKHSNAQLQEIKVEYRKMYKIALEEDLKIECSGKFLQGLLSLLMRTEEFEAKCLEKALKGTGTNDSLVIELICPKDAHEMKILSSEFKQLTGKELEPWIDTELSGNFLKLIKLLVSLSRDASDDVDVEVAGTDADALYKAGVGKIGTNEKVFIDILGKNNFKQIKRTMLIYKNKNNMDLQKAIRKEMSGNIEKSLCAIADCAENRPLYFAKHLKKAMKGVGTKDDDLIRLLVTRCSIDLPQIKTEYEEEYGRSLYLDVKDELSGDYQMLLLNLIGEG